MAELFDGGSDNNGSNGGNFYLEGDEAKSLGNTDFMRKPKSIRRTFPKTLTSSGLEMIQEVSSLEAKVIKRENGQVSETKTSSVSSSASSSFESTNGNGQSTPKEAEERRSNDSSLDLFRSMARKIGR